MHGIRLFRPYETDKRLFGIAEHKDLTPDQTAMLINQLDYWRSLGLNAFTDLTTLNMDTKQQSVYMVYELPLDMLFMTFTKVTEKALSMTLEQIRDYWLERFRSNNYEITFLRVAVEDHADGLTRHWHVVARFKHHYYFRLSHLRVPRKIGPNNSIAPVWRFPQAGKYVTKYSEFIDWIAQGVDFEIPPIHPSAGSKAQKPMILPPQQSVVLEPSIPELPSTSLDIALLFANSDADHFAKVMRQILKNDGYKGFDCWSAIEFDRL